ncbi:helix-turn-helix domain-containing protein [Azospirillum griseum]|nr:helix-turn-helix domain-containing protein [Azospirillum griseum]
MSVATQDFDGAAPEEMIPLALGRSLRRLRTRQGLSLERLSRLSGVSRAMLSQIELGRSAPTITVLWKIARALDVSLATLTRLDGRGEVSVLRRDDARSVVSADGLVRTRALMPPGEGRWGDFHEIRLRPGGCEGGGGHPPGCGVNLVVVDGGVDLSVGAVAHRLGAGDAAQFDADAGYRCRNVGSTDAVVFLVLSFGDA